MKTCCRALLEAAFADSLLPLRCFSNRVDISNPNTANVVPADKMPPVFGSRPTGSSHDGFEFPKIAFEFAVLDLLECSTSNFSHIPTRVYRLALEKAVQDEVQILHSFT